ncbi:MAG: EutN/CcmL family microcompartment protein [Verrucomicrobia bacterium]|nr:EutN/CcmL family microcompartment protein [Verrucomicrobiota bacterium]
MRLGHVIGNVTLSQQDPAYRGGRFLLVQPWSAARFATPAAPSGSGTSLVVYDKLGAGVGSIIGYTEGSEAAKPFATATPVDAYCAAIIDEVFYQPPI